VAFTAVLASTTPASAAIRPFAPPQTVVGGCSTSFADSVVTSTGALAGFATCPSPSGVPIRFFSRNADGTVNPSQGSGFTGIVLGVASDATATYVLYFTDSEIRIGKRTTAGAFSSRAVDSWGGAAVYPTGDVIARDGRWFGVWSEQVGPGGEFAQTDLFAAGSTVAVHRVTAAGADDVEPTLAYSGPLPVLIWTRATAPAVPGPSDLMVAKYISGAWEPERVFAGVGTNNYSPDVHIAAGRTFVTWYRDGFIRVAGNATGSFTSHQFNTGGYEPRVATSTTGGAVDHVFVAWTRAGGAGTFFAESASTGSVLGPWDGASVTPAGARAVGVGGHATRATVTYGTDTAVVARTQS
jgi:hypothetical protein